MNFKCPGQDARNLRVSLYKCPECGANVELFSDESRIKCQKCKSWVYHQKSQSCAEWCSSARKCLGDRWPGNQPPVS